MALAATSVFEVRTTGSDNNGGGFNPSRTGAGVDYSQQDTAQASGTNLTVDATTNTDVTPDGHTPSSDDIGNIIQITAGTGFTAGFYEIVSIESGKWRLDRSPAATSTSGGTWALGGALLTIDKAADSVVAGATIYIKAGIYAEHVTTSVAATTATPIKFISYSTTRGDNGKATITGSDSRARCVDVGASCTPYWWFNFIFTGATSALFGTRDATAWTFTNCEFYSGSTTVQMGSVVSGFSGSGFTFINCDIHDLSSMSGTRANSFYGSKIHDINASPIVIPNFQGGAFIFGCLIYDNNGWGIDAANNANPFIYGNIFYNNASGGVRLNGGAQGNTGILNNIFVNNGSVGIQITNALSGDSQIRAGHNAFYGQTTEQDTSKYNIYLDNDITLAADPFTDAANGDFTLTDAAVSALEGYAFPNQFGSPNVTESVIGPLGKQLGGGGGTSEHAYTFVGV